MQRLALGSLLAAVVMFLWGFLFWGAGLGAASMQHGLDNDAIRAAIAAHVPATGTYFVPDMEHRDTEAFLRLHKEGPVTMMFVRKEGADAMSPSVFALGFLHMFVSTLLMAYLVRMALPALGSFGARLCFVTMAGFVGSFWGHVADPIWFFHPWTFHLWTMGYDIVAWTLAGAVLAKFARA